MKKFASMFLAILFFPAWVLGAALMEGMVEKVDKDKKQIVLKTDKGQETVEFTSGTKGAEKVKVGDKITVTYSQKGEKLVASEIKAAKGEAKGQMKSSPWEKPESPGGKKEKTSASTNDVK